MMTGVLEGERRKANRLTLLETRRAAIINRARRALVVQALNKGHVTADDIRASVELPDGIDPRCLGSVPGPLAKAGIIRLGGFVKSDRPRRHASYIALWELIDPHKARAWLEDHPDIPPNDGHGQLELFDMDLKTTTPAVGAVGVDCIDKAG